MATLFKRKGGCIWYVDYVYQGRRKRKSTRTSDRKLAELFLKDIEVKIAKDKFGFDDLSKKKILFEEFIVEYLNYSKAVKADKTYQIDSRVLNNFKDFVGNIQLIRITQKHAEDFKIKRLQEIEPVSVNIRIRQLKAAFEKAVKWGYIEKNPLKDVEQCKVKNKDIPKFLTKDEVLILLDTIPKCIFKNYILFCLYTGCRRGEALNLTWDDIDLKSGKVKFMITKTGKSRIIPINGALKNTLSKMERNGDKPFPFRKDFVTHKFKKYLRASGIKDHDSLKLHSLRHTFASHLVMSGVDLITVSKLLGHSSVRTTEMYAHLIPNHMISAVDRLNFN